jgi:hypothetical protein
VTRPASKSPARAVRGAATAFLLLFLSGCAQLPYVQLPSVAFQRAVLRGVALDLGGRGLRLDLGFELQITNPYSVPLGVPTHQFRLLLDGLDLPVHLGRREAFSLPAGAATPVEYPVVVALDPQKLRGLDPLRLLGRDVPYTFVSDIEIELPFGLGVRPFRVEHSDTLRFPALSQIRLGGWPPR